MYTKEVLSKLIYNLPIFDETESGKPNLEDLAKELNIKYPIEAEQEEIAYKIVQFITSVPILLEVCKSTLEWIGNELDLTYTPQIDNVIQDLEQAINETEGVN